MIGIPTSGRAGPQLVECVSTTGAVQVFAAVAKQPHKIDQGAGCGTA